MSFADFRPFLSFDEDSPERLASVVTRWANINSYTYNLAGLEKMLEVLERDFSVLGGEIQRIELPPQSTMNPDGQTVARQLGKALRIRKRPDTGRKIFLCCHMDTVFPEDHEFQNCARVGENTLTGPGVADAKGGLLVMLTALQCFEKSPWAGNLGWEVLINPDEEIGSPGSAPLLVQAAKENNLGLIFEPCFPDGRLVGSRKGSGNFSVLIRGKAAHAGRDPHAGRNAINAAAQFILELNAIHDPDREITVNAGYIEGGGPVNVVPDRVFCRFNVRVATKEEQQRFEQHLSRTIDKINAIDGISLTLAGGFGRKPKPLDEGTSKLLEGLLGCGRDLGMNLQWTTSGGTCDGNNLTAEGLITVDSLGPRGGNIHTGSEYVLIDSLVERAKLSGLLLMKLASAAIEFP
jgi:glutamate carboxypeptidase